LDRHQLVLLLLLAAAVAVSIAVWRRRRDRRDPDYSAGSSVVPSRSVVAKERLPDAFPTHLHEAAFWQELGRVVATFGFLEETLGRAIFAFTATRPYKESEIQAAFAAWLPTLERALSDPLGKLIGLFEGAVRAHPGATITNLDELVSDLRKAAEMRNVLCHGSWPPPDAQGRSIPFFVDTKKRVFDTPVDLTFLWQVQKHAAELACEVINTVTHMGLQFPGSGGPGKPIWPV
jgi:hypothetical protein